MADEPVTRETYAYAARDGYRPLELDAFRVDGPGGREVLRPLVVMLHGGGWLRGSRRSFGPRFDAPGASVFDRVARAGYVVVSVDYRLSGEARFPAQLDDIAGALAWLAAHATELGADPARTVLWGESAGGHLASLAALAHTRRPDAADPEVAHVAALALRGVVAWYAPSNLSTMAAQARSDAVADVEAPDSRESRLLGSRPSKAGELARAASPALQVHPGAPPFLLVHGDVDRFVPVGQSVELQEALQAAGVPSRLELVAGADHMWLGLDDVEPVLGSALGFLGSVTGEG